MLTYSMCTHAHRKRREDIINCVCICIPVSKQMGKDDYKTEECVFRKTGTSLIKKGLMNMDIIQNNWVIRACRKRWVS